MPFVSRRTILSLLVAGLTTAMLVHEARGQVPKGVPNSPAAIRKVLEQNITLDFQGTSLDDALEHLRQKTKLKIVFDNTPIQLFGPGGNNAQNPGGPGLPGFPGPPDPVPNPDSPGVTLKIDNGGVRVALQNLINRYRDNLTYVILGDTVVITTEENGHRRQLRQRIDIDINEQPLSAALGKLADDTGVNLLIDPRQAEKAKTKVTVQLSDVTLDTTLRLLTELADLGTVSMGNVILVTSDARADKLRKDNAATGTKGGMVIPPGFGGGLGGFGGGFGGIFPN